MKAIRVFAIVVGSIAFGIASAVLAVFGASTRLDGRPLIAALLGALVATGIATPPVVRTFAARARLSALSVQEKLRWHADAIRESIVSAGAGLGLRDVGVHIFLKRRRLFCFWRHEFTRYARSAWSDRSPEPTHAVWREHWCTGKADGLVGIAAEQDARVRVNLLDDAHQGATKRVWDDWYLARDPRGLGVSWERGEKSRRWFSTIWTEPVPAPAGDVVAIITVNVEREIPDGYARLEAAGTAGILQSIARGAGYSLAGVSL